MEQDGQGSWDTKTAGFEDSTARRRSADSELQLQVLLAIFQWVHEMNSVNLSENGKQARSLTREAGGDTGTPYNTEVLE